MKVNVVMARESADAPVSLKWYVSGVHRGDVTVDDAAADVLRSALVAGGIAVLDTTEPVYQPDPL